jgi:hypothetical protein
VRAGTCSDTSYTVLTDRGTGRGATLTDVAPAAAAPGTSRGAGRLSLPESELCTQLPLWFVVGALQSKVVTQAAPLEGQITAGPRTQQHHTSAITAHHPLVSSSTVDVSLLVSEDLNACTDHDEPAAETKQRPRQVLVTPWPHIAGHQAAHPDHRKTA